MNFQKNKAVVYILLAMLVVLLFLPIPYYQIEDLACKPGQTNCPKKGWHLGPSLARQIKSIFSSTQAPIAQDEKERFFGDMAKWAEWKTYSSNGKYIVSEAVVGDYNYIIVKDFSGNIITDDLIKKNEDAIGYGIKFRCQCGTSFAGWLDDSHFKLKIVNANDEEYEYIIDASAGTVDEDSFKRIK